MKLQQIYERVPGKINTSSEYRRAQLHHGLSSRAANAHGVELAETRSHESDTDISILQLLLYPSCPLRPFPSLLHTMFAISRPCTLPRHSDLPMSVAVRTREDVFSVEMSHGSSTETRYDLYAVDASSHQSPGGWQMSYFHARCEWRGNMGASV